MAVCYNKCVKERDSKKIYDPEEVENRVMLAMLRRRVARKEAADAKSSEADLSKIEAQSGVEVERGISKLQRAPSGMLRPELSLPTGERLRTLWLIGIALAESLPKLGGGGEGAAANPASSGHQGAHASGSADAQREGIKRCGPREDEG